jgi:hypothetical protein
MSSHQFLFDHDESMMASFCLIYSLLLSFRLHCFQLRLMQVFVMGGGTVPMLEHLKIRRLKEGEEEEVRSLQLAAPHTLLPLAPRHPC